MKLCREVLSFWPVILMAIGISLILMGATK